MKREVAKEKKNKVAEGRIRRRKKSLFPADLFELANRGQERETIGCFNYPITGVR